MSDKRTRPGRAKPWASLNWPNRISLVRLLLVAPFIALLLNQDTLPRARHLALLVFVAMAASDFVDGVLARRLHQRTRLGTMLDPLADKVLIICSVILLSLPQTAVPGAQISNWVVVAVVAKDLWVILGFLMLYLVTGQTTVYTVQAGKVSTCGQLVMVALVLAAPDLNALSAGIGSQLASVAGWLVAGLSVVAVISYTRLGLSMVAESDRPVNESDPKEVESDEHD